MVSARVRLGWHGNLEDRVSVWEWSLGVLMDAMRFEIRCLIVDRRASLKIGSYAWGYRLSEGGSSDLQGRRSQ